MRINLKTPFADKDAAKALGARWDGARKIWYITDVADLTPFMRWIPDLQAATVDASAGAPQAAAPIAAKAPANHSASGVVTKPTSALPHCGCQALPWLDCEHTAAKST
jgi:hypothetical protein